MDSARPIVLQPAARGVLVCLQYAYPVVLLVFFVIAFMVQSIRNAPEDQELPPARGPGGKPLPRTKKRTQQEQALRQPQIDFTPGRKRAFVFVTAGVVLTFLGNAAIVVLHALVDRQDGWWCGQHVAVCFEPSHNFAPLPVREYSMNEVSKCLLHHSIIHYPIPPANVISPSRFTLSAHLLSTPSSSSP